MKVNTFEDLSGVALGKAGIVLAEVTDEETCDVVRRLVGTTWPAPVGMHGGYRVYATITDKREAVFVALDYVDYHLRAAKLIKESIARVPARVKVTAYEWGWRRGFLWGATAGAAAVALLWTIVR